MLKDYPDVMNIDQMCEILGVSTKTGYGLKNGEVTFVKIGCNYRIPKAHTSYRISESVMNSRPFEPPQHCTSNSAHDTLKVSTAGNRSYKQRRFLYGSRHLQEKKGYFYMVLTYKDHEGKRKSKWISTKLPVKVVPRNRTEMLEVETFEPDIPVSMEDMLFHEFFSIGLR